MAYNQKPARWYCRTTPTGKVEGPFLLVELAGLLRSGAITGETLTQAEDDEDWMPFKSRREFLWAKELPMEAVLRHLDTVAKAKEEAAPFSWRKLYYLLTFLGGFSLFASIFIIRWLYRLPHLEDNSAYSLLSLLRYLLH